MVDSTQLFSRMLACAMFGLFAVPASVQAEGGWDWFVAPYLWMSDVSADLSVKDRDLEISESFSDILDKLDLAYQIHLEGVNGQFGFFGDYTYIRLGDKTSQGSLTLDSEMTTWLTELAGVYRPSGRFDGIQAFAGLRYLKVDQQMKIKGDLELPVEPAPSVRLDESFTDFMIGLRYLGNFSENWFYSLRGDWAGGGSEGTWNLVGSVGWRFPGWESGSLMLGYRYMDMELEDKAQGTRVNMDMTMNGPYLGLGIAF